MADSITFRRASKVAQVSTRTLRRSVTEGKLVAHKINGVFRVDVDELGRFLAERERRRLKS